MDFLKCMDNFPWNRFSTVYETSSKCLKEPFTKMWNGNAKASDYEFVINRLEHQETLYRISPWGLKFYTALLETEKADKSIVLQNIKILFEAANFHIQIDAAQKYKPTKGNLIKYEQIKSKLFEDGFDGTMDAEYLKIFKSIDRNFMHLSILDFLKQKKQLFETLTESTNHDTSESAKALLSSMTNPRIYEFNG